MLLYTMRTKLAPPWAELPATVGDHVRPHLPAIVDEVIAAVGHEVPAYRRPLEGDFGRSLRLGVEVALARFLELPGTSELAVGGTDREVYVALGRGELLAGRTFEALLAAYRVGARVAFRRFAELARSAGLDADAVVPLAEATFAYIAPGEDGLANPLGPDALSAPLADGVVALVPAPQRPGQWRTLRRRLAGRRAVVGLVAPWADAAAALRPATRAMRLVTDGVLSGDPLFVDEHLVDLIVHRDPPLASALVARELAPLDAVRANTRERLAETLLAWLSFHGERARVAEALHVHPQTVAYRLGQLRELFGDALTDPDRRFALELALRASASAGAAQPG
jgi:hypothetical protein